MFKFLSNFFGEKKPEEKSLEEAKKIVLAELEKEKKIIFEKVSNSFAELKYLIKEANQSIETINNKKIGLTKEDASRLERIVRTTKTQLSNSIQKKLQKIFPPNTENLNKIQEYCEKSYNEFFKSIKSSWKNIIITRTLFEKELKELGIKLKEIEKTLNSLNSLFSENSKIFQLQKIKKIIFNLEENKKILKHTEQKLQKLNEELIVLKDDLNNKKKEIENLNKGKKAQELQKLKTQLSQNLSSEEKIKTEAINLIAPISKELQRLEKLVSSGNYLLEKETLPILKLYLSNPLLAIQKDSKSIFLRNILKETLKAINENKIVVKEKEIRKKKKKISELLEKDLFSEIFWELNKLTVEKKELNEKIQCNTLSKDLLILEDELKKIEEKIQTHALNINIEKTQKREIQNKIKNNVNALNAILLENKFFFFIK